MKRKYFLYREIYEEGISYTVLIHKALYELRVGDSDVTDEDVPKILENIPRFLHRTTSFDLVTMPCKANLHKILTLIYFDGDFRTDTLMVEISEEDVKWLRIVMKYPRSYATWRKVLKPLKNGVSKEEAKKILKDELAKLRLRVAVENGREN